MLAKSFGSAALALMASRLVMAQTYSDCNPVEGDDCDPDPAFGDDSVTIDFTQGESDYFYISQYTDSSLISYDDSMGCVFTLNNDSQAPTMISEKYLFFGRVDAVIQAAPGTGIVTSFLLQSDDLDEIDWEWVGSDTEQAQSNYFGKGNTTTYDRGAYHSVDAVTTEFHTYSIDWTSERIEWIVDDEVVRTLYYADAVDGTQYPQTPMQVRLGSWVGGSEDNSEGTIEWAGGLADWDNGPYLAYYQSITITDYANGVSGASEYVYTDDTGDYTSIEVVTGDSSDDDSDDDGESTTTTTATSAASSTLSSSTVNSTTTTGPVSTTEGTITETPASTTLGTTTTSASNATSSSSSSSDSDGDSTGGASTIPVTNSVFAACIFILAAMML